MTPEERQLLAGLFDRVRGAAGNPRDRDAETFIADAVRAQPYAPYLLAQTVIVQEEGLKAAAAKIEELESRVRDAQSQASSGGGGFLGGIGRSMFGSDQRAADVRQPSPAPGPWGGQAAPQPQPQSQAPWAQQQAPWSQPQAGSSSFLKGALGAAAGVAGGMLLANSLSGLFSGHHNSLGIGSGLDSTGFSPTGSPLDNQSDRSASFTDAGYNNDDHADDDDDDSDGDTSDDGVTDV